MTKPEPIAALDPEASGLTPDRTAFFLDVDGTLIEIAHRPEAVRVEPGLPLILASVQEAVGGAIAVVSGRPLVELDRLLRPLKLPSAGQHGLEHRAATGQVGRAATDISLFGGFEDSLRTFVADHPGTMLEHKGMTLALHYRNAVQARNPARTLVAALIADHADRFQVYDGKMVFEIKPVGVDKGTAVARFMQDEPAFRSRVPLFIGDDATDEFGFAAAQARGGLGLQVGDREPTVADYRITDVLACHRWLAAFARMR